ncbi:hypothetical protein C8R44DRAFT_978066 [Mycena epipterygia]|nr:hypothetical protein C8R44DRAFT_978066 [Mycena epipterygia]
MDNRPNNGIQDLFSRGSTPPIASQQPVATSISSSSNADMHRALLSLSAPTNPRGAAIFNPQQVPTPPSVSTGSSASPTPNETQGRILLEQLMAGNPPMSSYSDSQRGAPANSAAPSPPYATTQREGDYRPYQHESSPETKGNKINVQNPRPQAQNIVLDVSQSLDEIQASRDVVNCTAVSLLKRDPVFLSGTIIGATHWIAYAMTRGRVRVILRSNGDHTLLQLPPGTFQTSSSVCDMAICGNRLAGVTSDGGFVIWELPQVITDDVPGQVLLCVPPVGSDSASDALHSVKWDPKEPNTLAVASLRKVYLIDLTHIRSLRGQPVQQLDLPRLSQVFSIPASLVAFDFDILHYDLATISEDSSLIIWNIHSKLPYTFHKIGGEDVPSSLTYVDGGIVVGRKNGTIFQLLSMTSKNVLSTITFMNGNQEDPDMFGHVCYDSRIQTLWVANCRRKSLIALKIHMESSMVGGEVAIRGYIDQVVEFAGPMPTIHFAILTADADPTGDEALSAFVAAKLVPGKSALVAFSMHSGGVDQILIRKEWFENALSTVPSKFPAYKGGPPTSRIPPVELKAQPAQVSMMSSPSVNLIGDRSLEGGRTCTPALDRIHDGPWLEIHRHLTFYAVLGAAPGVTHSAINDIGELSKSWAEWDILTSLANYHSVSSTLLEYIVEKERYAAKISEEVSQDILAVLAQMDSIFHDEKTYEAFLTCRGAQAQKLLDLLQDLLDLPLPPNLRPVLSKALMRLCRASMLHPTCFPLPGLERVGQQVAGGGFGDICKGLVGAAEKELGREAAIWRQLSHPNLLPFLGVYRLNNTPDNHLDNTLNGRLDTRLCLISPWMENGDIPHFLSDAPADIDHVSLLLDIAMGLEYLHMNGVVHGDLKGANILVTPSGRACITDFGFSSISQTVSLQFTHSTRTAWGGSPRYQAPELLSFEQPTRNHAGSDVYAFACLGYEIYTRKKPFFEVPNDMAVILGVLKGYRPSNDPMIPEAIWKLFQDCWEQDAEKRLTVPQITKRLLSPSIGASQIQTPTDWDETFSSRFRRSVLPGAFALRPQHQASPWTGHFFIGA